MNSLRDASHWLKPNWLRPVALVAGLAINLGAGAMIALAQIDVPMPLDAVEVAILPNFAAPPPEPEAQQPEKPPEKPEPEKPAPEPPPPETPPPPPPPPPEPPPPEPPPPPKVEQHKPDETLVAQRRKEEKREERKVQERERRKAAESKAAKEKASQNSGVARAAYPAVAAGEIRRLWAGLARSAGVAGRVSLSFSVGPSGRVVSHSASSDEPKLEAAAHAVMRSFHTVPPPDGHFSGAINLSASAR